MNRDIKNKVLPAILLTALIARVGLLMIYGGTDIAEQYDSKEYHSIAVNLLHGKGFTNETGPTEIRPPVYPLFLAGIYSVFGYNDFWVKFMQCLLDTASVLLIFRLGLKAFGMSAAVLAAGIGALYPPMILYSNLRLGETLFTFLLVTEAYLWQRTLESGSMKHGALTGVAHGLATLCRSTTLLFPLFVLPVGFLLAAGKRRFLRAFAVYFLVGSCIISVWSVRNYSVFGKYIPVNLGAGALMWFAIQENVWQGDKLIELRPESEYTDIIGMPMRVSDGIVARRVVKYTAAHPIRYAKMLLRNEIQLWYLPVGKVILSGKSRLLASLYQYAHYLFLGGAFVGLFFLSRKRAMAWAPFLTLLVYVAVMHSIVLPVPRYRLPFDFILILLFANGVINLRLKTQ